MSTAAPAQPQKILNRIMEALEIAIARQAITEAQNHCRDTDRLVDYSRAQADLALATANMNAERILEANQQEDRLT